ncbi:TPA: hypothetical protein P0E24_004662 [Vibrio campbellii]|nr:hypothetical protein [Vibrio campbellii]
MEFRYPAAVAATNTWSLDYLTRDLSKPEAGEKQFEALLEALGNAVENYPDWHPILTAPQNKTGETSTSLSGLSVYKGIDHTVKFVRGFVTCPYSEETADQLVNEVKSTPGLHAYRLNTPLYSDHAYPVVIQAIDVDLEADGTIRSRDALIWCTQRLVKDARNAQVAETWWNRRSDLLGSPHGSRSSLFVNQHTGGHLRKILDALNNSGMYGPIYEWSLDMLSEKKRKTISSTLIRTAVSNWKKKGDKFEFELRGETCKAEIRDTWGDGEELSVRVTIGDSELCASGFYHPQEDRLEASDPKGKRALAEKFL